MSRKIAIIIIIILGMFIIFQPKPTEGYPVEEINNCTDSLNNETDTLNLNYIPIETHRKREQINYIPQTIEREEYIPQIERFSKS
tara:strand:+ start:544 stop:798 length:255 start_codon:yes stop_codon:yes gene_type:complete